MNKLFSSQRAKKNLVNTGIIALVVAIVIMLNAIITILGDKFDWYLDMTDEQIYTISDALKETLNGANMDVEVIEHATEQLTEGFICTLQKILKEGTQHANAYGAGQYKSLPNIVGGIETTKPAEVAKQMQKLLSWYNGLTNVSFADIVEFHYKFETIHPFQDGNGRIGRLIAFKQCLENNIVPFYIDDANKWLYYRGLREWQNDKNYLIETCLFGQDQYKILMSYFGL